METTLAILLVLGIFVGIPAVIGLGVVATYKLGRSVVVRTQWAKVQPA